MPPIRPATISELAAAAAAQSSPSTSADLKTLLRRAENHRKMAGIYMGRANATTNATNDPGLNLERAFMEYARAATLIVETIPAHREYLSDTTGKGGGLTAEQRSNLTANGEDLLHQLGRLKAALVERYERYARSPGARGTRSRHSWRRSSSKPRTTAPQVVSDEAARWRAQREEAASRDAALGYVSSAATSAYGSSAAAYASASSAGPASGGPAPTYLSSASQAAVAAAARAAGVPAPASVPVSLASQHAHQGGQLAALPATFARTSAGGGAAAYNAYPSSAGVSFPQPATNTGGSQSSYAPSYTSNPDPSPSPSTLYPSTASTPSISSYSSSSAHSTPAPGPMPLRPPNTYATYEWESGESTDEERPSPHLQKNTHISYPGTGMPFPTHGQDDIAARMARLGTSDSPIEGLPSSTVAYPALARHMSSHQRTQGYVPGAWGSALPPAVPAFEAYAQGGQQGRQQDGNFAGVGASNWPQQQQALGAARAAAVAPATTVGYSTPFSPPADPRASQAQAQARARADAEAARDAERIGREADAREEQERLERKRNGGKPRLRTVLLPHATLPRFLSIASGNTARNLETCGLLLGREVGRGSSDSASFATTASGKTRYVVSTLLIPKQHATSDTCTMDEEEGVLGFTEERGLITLGWIHTHPSQSCFMSSVDLHTHASFQCMLPESFAVVCAPKSDPSFGIFRLTDPPGLQTVLKCTERQAFHPHPDVPIYTDADKGHVQMRDAALEIVDLR
ncbi:hypothetical protein C8R47DRAFT_1324009 [Mycena vitilis]|nr:hypothetical protein C8R47DRAFT_1324009 [Mycena vitilis]